MEKPELTADQVLEKIGRDFATTHPRNRKQAWNDVVLTLMTNLSVLSKAESASQVKDVINIARDIDEANGGAGGERPNGEPLDRFAEQWVQDDVKPEKLNGTSD